MALIAGASWDVSLAAGLVAALIYAFGTTLYSLHARLKDVERDLRALAAKVEPR